MEGPNGTTFTIYYQAVDLKYRLMHSQYTVLEMTCPHLMGDTIT